MTDSDLNNKYKNVFLNSFDNKSSYENTKIDHINTFLEKESINNKTEAWNKLDKTGKIKLLNNYVDSLITVNNLSATDVAELKHYLTDSLDKKKLQHVKDVVCDKATGKILSIPTLHFNIATRKYTLKRAEKRVSTLKSLGKGKGKAPVQQAQAQAQQAQAQQAQAQQAQAQQAQAVQQAQAQQAPCQNHL